MSKKLGCLHAHYSNIEYIENAFASFDVELNHFVDPALMYRVTFDEGFSEIDAKTKVIEQIEWIAQSNVDAILITCTNYIAILPEDQLSIPIPIIKMDEPYFDSICNIQQPQIILFTNPATVEGTLERLYRYAKTRQKSLDLEALVIENTFELLMQGRKKEYNQEICKFINQMIHTDNKVISVAQLSMVDASKEAVLKNSKTIINPLDTLLSSIIGKLEIKNNRVPD